MSKITIELEVEGPVTQGVAQALAQQTLSYADAAYDDVFAVTDHRVTQDAVERFWQHDNEPDRIHYISDGKHLYTDRGTVLFEMLAADLRDRAGV